MKVRKAVIPAAGLGTRFLPATKAQPKEMLPVVDKPAIQYVVEEAARGASRTSSSSRDEASAASRTTSTANRTRARARRAGQDRGVEEVRSLSDLAAIHFIRQGEALGLGHAVGMASKHVGDQPFVVLLGDDLIDERVLLLEAMIAAAEQVEHSVVALMAVDDPSALRLRPHGTGRR